MLKFSITDILENRRILSKKENVFKVPLFWHQHLNSVHHWWIPSLPWPAKVRNMPGRSCAKKQKIVRQKFEFLNEQNK